MAFLRASFSESSLFRRGTAFGTFVGEFDCFLRGLRLVAQFFKRSFSALTNSPYIYFSFSFSISFKALALKDKGKEIKKNPSSRKAKMSTQQLIAKFFKY